MTSEGNPDRPGRAGAEELKGADLARALLAAARADARAKEAARGAGTRAAARQQARTEREERPSGEPLALGSAVRELVDERGWTSDVSAARVLSSWESIVGAEVAAAS